MGKHKTMDHYGVRGTANSLFENNLSEQFVSNYGVNPINLCAVPHGSVL